MIGVATLQILLRAGDCSVGVLRFHPTEGTWEEAADWTWGCTLRVTGDFAELFGAKTAPPWPARKAIRKLFYGMGIKRVWYEIKGIAREHKQ
jgi:hypothetical protein